jgi:hypothetical protein
MKNNCKTCDHSLRIGEEVKTGKKVFECHRIQGKPKYVGYGSRGSECEYYIKRDPKIHKLYS